MNEIGNEAEFKQILEGLDPVQQRQVAALFVEHVLPLSHDRRLDGVVRTAGDPDATKEELSAALRSAMAVTFDSHAVCGAEGHWSDQAGYFVARAAAAATTSTEHSRAGGAAWQAAMSARMAHTSMLIDDASNEDSLHSECEWQHQCLSDFINA